jgi:hypothetical protein
MPPKPFNPSMLTRPVRVVVKKAYEPSCRPKDHVRRDLTTQEPPQNPLQGVSEGSRCPRPHCGGLIALRAVVTLDGTCEELYCSSCARSVLQRVLEPYVPIPSVRDPRVDALLVPDREAGDVDQGIEGNGDIVEPEGLHESAALRRVWSDESLPLPPLDTH